MASNAPISEPSRLAWLNRLPLTLEGLLWVLMALGILITGLVKVINLITLLACFLLAMVGWNYYLARRQLKQVTLHELDAEPAFAGLPWHWQVLCRCRQRRSVRSVRIQCGEDAHLRVFVPVLSAGASVVVGTSVVFPHRGVVELDPLQLVSGYPLGLVQVRVPKEPARELIVLPRLFTLRRGTLRTLLHLAGVDQAARAGRSKFHAAAQMVFHGLRLYRPGDSPRLIHWRTTARLGEPMVREFEDPLENGLTLVVDARRPADDADFEHLVSLVATICWEYCRQRGDSFLLVIAGSEVRSVGGTTGPSLARALLEMLATEPGTDAADEAAVARLLSEQPLPPGPVLVAGLRGSTLAIYLLQTLRRNVVALDANSELARDLLQEPDEPSAS